MHVAHMHREGRTILRASMRVAFLAPLLLLLISAVPHVGAVACECHTSENIAILQDLYESTEGPRLWYRKWNLSVDTVCNLPEVRCAGASIVTLYFNNNNLGGTLPLSLGNLENLTDLRIYYGSLHGTLPSTLTRLTALSTLYLYTLSFGGTVPSLIRDLPALRYLMMYSCSLTGTFPSFFVNMTKLLYLDLEYNQLAGTIPGDICNMTSLYALELFGNRFSSTLPSTITNMTALRTLGVSFQGDRSSTAPQFLAEMPQLRYLRLQNIRFDNDSFPIVLCSLFNLATLEISSSALKSSFPDCITTSLPSLKYLGLSGNSFNSTLPSTIYKLLHLTTFVCQSCMLQGELSFSSLSSMVNLSYLQLHFNGAFEGTLDGIETLTNLQWLFAASCALSGTIPDSIGAARSLRSVHLGGNSFVGSIPSSIGNLSSLASLVLYGNNLSGTVPSSFGWMSNLVYCHLSNNQLNGTLPWDALANMSSLQQLYLHANSLSGSLPVSHGVGFKQLRTLFLEGNSFTGGLPQAWHRLPLLSYLRVGWNKMTGVLPPVWAVKQDWLYLFLGGNRFTGILPPQWARMTLVENVSLSYNTLKGALPAEWGSGMPSAVSVVVNHNNELCGDVPNSWTNRSANLSWPNPASWANKSCRVTRYVTLPPPNRFSRLVTLGYCAAMCNKKWPGYFPATPQTYEELTALTRTATVDNGASAAKYFLLGGGMIPSDRTTLRWLSGALGDTDDGEGTIFYTERAPFPRQCVMPCGLNLSTAVLLRPVMVRHILTVDRRNGSWVMVDPTSLRGQIGCICQNGTLSARAPPADVSSTGSSSFTRSKVAATTTDSLLKTASARSTSSKSASVGNVSKSVTATRPKTLTRNTTVTGVVTTTETVAYTSTVVRTRTVTDASSSTKSVPSLTSSSSRTGPLGLSLTVTAAMISHTESMSPPITVATASLSPSIDVARADPQTAVSRAADAMASTAAVLSGPAAFINGGSADGAILAVVLQVACGQSASASGGKSSGVAWLRYTISPFYDLGYFWMVCGNLLVVTSLWCAAACSSRLLPLCMPRRFPNNDAAAASLSHPSLCLRVAAFLVVGVLFGSCRLLSSNSSGSGSAQQLPSEVVVTVAVVGVLLTAVFLLYSVFVIARCVKPVVYEVALESRLMSRFMPTMEWKPDQLVATHGSLFAQYRHPISIRLSSLLIFLPTCVTALAATEFPEAACVAQLVMMLSIQVALVVIVALRRPFRAPLVTPLTAASDITVAVIVVFALYSSLSGDNGVIVQYCRSILVITNSVCTLLKLVYNCIIALLGRRSFISARQRKTRLDNDLMMLGETSLHVGNAGADVQASAALWRDISLGGRRSGRVEAECDKPLLTLESCEPAPPSAPISLSSLIGDGDATHRNVALRTDRSQATLKLLLERICLWHTDWCEHVERGTTFLQSNIEGTANIDSQNKDKDCA